MKIIAVKSHTLRSACTAARRVLGLRLEDSREVFRSGGDDGLWRVYLQDGTIVECTIIHWAKTEVLCKIRSG
jgi:hypothetical protein